MINNLVYYIMNDEITYKLINESTEKIMKDVISKHYNSYEKINNNEIRIITDLSTSLSDIKNNLNIISDRLVDKFKIINKDMMFKLLANHIYNNDTKESILMINKIIPININLTDEQLKIIHVNYLYNEFLKIIFNSQIVDFLKYYSDPFLIYVYYIKNFLRNWKITLVILIVCLMFYYFYKKLKKCKTQI